MKIIIKRIYEPLKKSDGQRILVDRIWPRGISKEAAALDGWWKELSPSPELRKWFGHDPKKYEAFGAQYLSELREKHTEIQNALDQMHGHKTLTLLYAAKDEVHNHARILRDFMQNAVDQF